MILTLLIAFGATSSLSAQPELSPETFAHWREYLLPPEPPTCWLGVPWRPSFAGAVVEAQEAERPVLLWAMNGHPLGCT